MAFFSQKEHKVKRSHSTERTKPHPTSSIASRPSLPTRTKSSSRPKTIYDPHPTAVTHAQGPDHKPPTSKLNSAPSTPRYSLRRVPVPSLSTQDLDGLPYDRSSPIVPSSRSTSISGKSSIADPGGAYNAAPPPTMKLDHLKSIDGTGLVVHGTPPHSPSHHWESSSGCSQNPGSACDPEKTVSPILSDLAVLVSSPKQLATPLPSPRPVSQKPQRAVLRRKSNAKPPKPQPNNQNLTQKKSKPDLAFSSVTTTPKRALSSARHPPHSVSTPPSSDAAHHLRRSSCTENLSSSSSPSPRVLTPAGAVVAAYKEQEMRRKYSKDDLSSRGSCGEIGGVYYTVFGSSGDVATVGKPDDENRSNQDLNSCVSTKPKDLSRKPSLGPLGRLSRKSSAKAKKNSGFMSESECGHESVTRHEQVRRSSFQGRRSTSVPAKHRRKKSLGIPIIGDSDFGLIWDSSQTPSKSAAGSVDEPSPSAGGKIWKLVKRLSTGGLREKYHAQETAPPVPALPEGLLQTPPPKSKPKTAQSVPHSPNDSKLPASRYVRGRASFGDAALMNRNTSIRGFPSPVPSSRLPAFGSGKGPSRRRQSINTRSPSPISSDMVPPKHWQKTRSSSVSTFEDVPPLPGRIVSEQILSPSELIKLEKDQATTELSSPPSTVDSHSPAATTSNYHGNTRNPSLRGLASSEDSEADGMSASEFATLPTPPRHHYKPNPHAVYHQSNGSSSVVGSVTTSPTIPMFSTQDVVNRFHPAKGDGATMSRSLNSSSMPQSPSMSSDEFGLVSPAQPPPRPRRSDKRKPLFVDPRVIMRASLDRDGRDGNRGRRVPPSNSVPPQRKTTLDLSSGLDDGEGRSYGTFGNSQSKGLVEFVSTSRDSSSSREDLTFSPSLHSRSPLRFREMGSGEAAGKDRKALTEKEKADKWHDLLERSDRAGGTIHIGNSKLPSDSLRFSDYSTLTTLAL
jgi:hypothetical protein